MLKKTVAGAALMAAALSMSAVPASAHAVPGAAGVDAKVSGTAQNVQWYGYGHPGYRHYYRPYAYRSWGYGPTPGEPIPGTMAAMEAGAIRLAIGVVTAGVAPA